MNRPDIYRIEEKCIKCMLCVKDCVSGVWRDIDGIPTVAEPDLCNRCSHCLAVCPAEAIVHNKLDAKQVYIVDKKLLSPKAYKEIILSRRSIRHYKDKEIPVKVVEEILTLASHSPSASNDQNVKYIVITDRVLLKKTSKKIFNLILKISKFTNNSIGKILLKITGLSKNRYVKLMDYYIKESEGGRDFILHNAPLLILIHAPEKANFAVDNCNIAGTNIINYAHSLNLGTCYIGFLTLYLKYSKKMRREFNLSKKSKVFVSLVMGYPDFKHKNTGSKKVPVINW
jgi:nitroreductase/Pyruvate/2-oxoacid:ferredoxin oxidoreductase delta subunit